MWVALVYNDMDWLVMVCGPFETATDAFNWASVKFDIKHRIETKPMIAPY